MAKRTRNLAMAAMAAAFLGTPGVSVAADALPGNQSVPGRHVRSSNSELIALIDQAGERSATFRSLVDTINASDSIVFVEPGEVWPWRPRVLRQCDRRRQPSLHACGGRHP
jgi:hypothetical protein